MPSLGCCFVFSLTFLAISGAKNLYNEGDPVDILTVENFNATIINASGDFIVQFYHAFCGHCINYAPIFKILATKFISWRPKFRIAVLNCASAESMPVCESLGVEGFPTVRYYPFGNPASVYTSRFALRSSSESQEMKNEVLPLILRHSRVKEFLPVENSAWSNSSKPNDYLLVKNVDPQQALLTVLDLSGQTKIPVLWSQATADLKSFPLQIHRIQPPSNETIIARSLATWSNVMPAVVSKLKELSLWNEVQSASAAHYLGGASPSSTADPKVVTWKIPDVHVNDLISAISRALSQDVSLHSVITGEGLLALKQFVHTLHLFLNVTTANLSHNLQVLDAALADIQAPLERSAWKNILNLTTIFATPLDDYRTCRGSESYLRGYPCSLWTLFHCLTVREYQEKETKDSKPLLVLPAMRSFILNFFSCTHCLDNFKKESQFLDQSMSDPRAAVLWLWRTHNSVNKRLANASSEDPHFPKVQFPSQNMCPQCYNAPTIINTGTDGISWNEEAVLSYLVSKYQPQVWAFSQSNDDAVDDSALKMVANNQKRPDGSSLSVVSSSLSFADNIVCTLVSSSCTLVLLLLFIAMYRRYRCIRMYYHNVKSPRPEV